MSRNLNTETQNNRKPGKKRKILALTAVAASLLLASMVSVPSITITFIHSAYAQSTSFKQMYLNCKPENDCKSAIWGGFDPSDPSFLELCKDRSQTTIVYGVCFHNSHPVVVQEWQCENMKDFVYLMCIQGTPGCPPGQAFDLVSRICANTCDPGESSISIKVGEKVSLNCTMDCPPGQARDGIGNCNRPCNPGEPEIISIVGGSTRSNCASSASPSDDNTDGKAEKLDQRTKWNDEQDAEKEAAMRKAFKEKVGDIAPEVGLTVGIAAGVATAKIGATGGATAGVFCGPLVELCVPAFGVAGGIVGLGVGFGVWWWSQPE